MKRNVLIAVFVVMFLLPAFASAVETDRFIVPKIQATTSEVVVPLTVENVKNLVAMDIPLGFSEGVTLEKVEFTDRVSGFEMKIANIDNDNHNVVIGLISMVTKEAPDMASGSGPIANLHFTVDESVSTLEIAPIELSKPSHTLTYYYNDYSSGVPEVRSIHPQMDRTEVSLAHGPAVPIVYALNQNYPNPFNPTTEIMYAIPEAGHVKVAVFNILGQNVRDLVNEEKAVGSYSVIWDGKDTNGEAVASGVYFYRIRANEFSETRKMLLLK